MKRTSIAVLTLLSYASPTTFAGASEPVPFRTLSMSVFLGQPYGNTEFIFECSDNKDSFQRTIRSITLLTQNGTFEAPRNILTDLRNPVAVEISSFPEQGELAVYIRFKYSAQPSVRRSVSVKFKAGTWKVYFH